jgi:tetratricopeptide (TPR) repeat protein
VTDKISKARKQLNRLSGPRRLTFLLKLIRNTVLRGSDDLSRELFKELIDENLPLIESTHSEEAAHLLLCRGTYFHWDKSLDKAELFVDKAIALARRISANHIEIFGLTLKGQIYADRGEHKKEFTYLQMALAKSSSPLDFIIHALMAQSFSKLGDYYEALSCYDKALALCDKYLDNPEIPDAERRAHTMFQIENLSLRAAVLINIGDIDAANSTFERAVNLAVKHDCLNKIYQLFSYSTKVLIAAGKFKEAEQYLSGISAHHLSDQYDIYIAKDWALLYQESKRYSEALNKYHEMFYGRSSDENKMDENKMKENIRNLMENAPEFFMVLLRFLFNCLVGFDKVKNAHKLRIAIQTFDEIISEANLFSKEVIDIKKDSILNILEAVFHDRPDRAIYNNIVAEFDPVKKIVLVFKGEEKIAKFKSRRGFLTIKYFLALSHFKWVTQPCCNQAFP